MIEKEIIVNIFELRFIEGLSVRKISSKLGNVHYNSVNKYIKLMENNLNGLKSSLILEGKCTIEESDEFIILNWQDYIDEITANNSTRKKRVLTDEVIGYILEISRLLNTTSSTEIYNYIHKTPQLRNSPLGELSASSIGRALKNK
ncbi:hypothetical protein [Geosporobacter ferrireducens]|uniref:Uncharacterized protein n=1 Tax=Geosporobacter ferrireducens TaxID=1424294 RepID=A0A1D8GPU8_9FIRM|nr:hypothetical protein [Geosporobacter ferrireducens]AOT72804.1 hypothetical protein Gferi_26545 [Geosporobacter ferrireducens]